MRAYVEFAKKKFINNMVYKFDYVMGIIDTLILFVTFNCIYKALYGTSSEIDGITFSMVSTNFILSLGLSNAFSFDDHFLENKLRDGSIVNEFVKPVNFVLRMLAENLGDSIFKVCFNFIPTLILVICFTKLEKPAGVLEFILFMLSIILGYLILWNLNVIVQMCAFWVFNNWGIAIIKNLLVNVLSGAMLPLWFMPEGVMKIIKYTPFDSIYFTPIKIFLGQMKGNEIVYNFGRQFIWIVILYLIGNALWEKGQRKLIVQGG
jgi:ABC-2 type transport system permease protein